jgi:hypothetical protein
MDASQLIIMDVLLISSMTVTIWLLSKNDTSSHAEYMHESSQYNYIECLLLVNLAMRKVRIYKCKVIRHKKMFSR